MKNISTKPVSRPKSRHWWLILSIFFCTINFTINEISQFLPQVIKVRFDWPMWQLQLMTVIMIQRYLHLENSRLYSKEVNFNIFLINNVSKLFFGLIQTDSNIYIWFSTYIIHENQFRNLSLFYKPMKILNLLLVNEYYWKKW